MEAFGRRLGVVRAQSIWIGFALLVCAASSGAQGGAPHVILSYDTSGSMAETYLGPNMHEMVRRYVSDMLFSPDGPFPEGDATEERRPDFSGFPLVGPSTVVSAFTFGVSTHPAFERQEPTPQLIESFFPKRFPDPKTTLADALKLAALKMFNPQKEEFAYWIYISDGQDDPMDATRNVGAADVFLTRDLALVYSITIRVPASHFHELLGRWKNNDAQLRRAFGDLGPPDRVVIHVFRLSDVAALRPPKQIQISSSADGGGMMDVVWYPGESAAEASTAPLSHESAQGYRIEGSTDRENWDSLSEVTADGSQPYRATIQLADPGSANYVRVVAYQDDLAKPSQWSVVTPSAQASLRSGDDSVTVVWEPPRGDGQYRVLIEKSRDGRNWEPLSESAGIDPQLGSWETTRVNPGEYVRVTLVAEGEVPGPGAVMKVPDRDLEAAQAEFKGVRAAFDKGSSTTTVSWRAPSDDDTQVTVERSEDGGQTFVPVADAEPVAASAKRMPVSNLSLGDVVRVSARTKNGDEFASAPTNVRAPASIAPFLVVLLLLAGLVAAGYFALKHLGLSRREFRIRLTADDGSISPDLYIPPGGRVFLGDTEDRRDLDIVWEEVDAPAYFLKNYRGQMHLYEKQDGLEIDQGAIVEGDEFTVYASDGRSVRMRMEPNEPAETDAAADEY